MWMWIVGVVILAGGAVVPPVLARRRSGRRAYVAARDRARSVMSRLEWALDQAGPGGSSGGTAEAQRCQLLAGSALAGPDTADGFREAERWARQGLSALGMRADEDADGGAE